MPYVGSRALSAFRRCDGFKVLKRNPTGLLRIYVSANLDKSAPNLILIINTCLAE